MNEPPIASPFGSYEPGKPILNRLPTPLLLKVFVGIELTSATFTVVAHMLGFGATPSFTKHHGIMIGAYIFTLLLMSIIYFGLWIGNKVSWWLVLASYLYIFGAALYKVSTHQVTHTTSVYPPFARSLLGLVNLAFFVYLLTPQARQFFFADSSKSMR